jgi:hypothetical protein
VPRNWVDRWESAATQRNDIRQVTHQPVQRAVRTCELAGFGSVTEIDPDPLGWTMVNAKAVAGPIFARNDQPGI